MLGAVAVAGAGGDAAVVDAPGVSGAAATGAMAGATPAAPEQLVQQQVQGGSEWINPFSGTQASWQSSHFCCFDALFLHSKPGNCAQRILRV